METLRPARARDWPVVLGIDPGTRAVGYGLVVSAPDRPRLLAAGVLRAGAKRPIAERLFEIRGGVEELIERFQPTHVALEGAFAFRDVRAALRIGEGRGVILACAACSGLAVSEYSPAAVKKSLVGNGAASKHQVARMVAATFDKPGLELAADATDALAIALTHVFRVLRAPRTIPRGGAATALPQTKRAAATPRGRTAAALLQAESAVSRPQTKSTVSVARAASTRRAKTALNGALDKSSRSTLRVSSAAAAQPVAPARALRAATRSGALPPAKSSPSISPELLARTKTRASAHSSNVPLASNVPPARCTEPNRRTAR